MKHIKRKFLFHDFLQKIDLNEIKSFESVDPKTITQEELKKVD